MLRKATIQDVKSIHKLLQLYGNQGILLARPLSQLYDHVRDFTVCTDDETQRLIGCGALQFCWEELAEIRSLAVHPDYIGKGFGRVITEAIIAEAQRFKTRKLFTLTYQPAFFNRFGFKKIDRAELPLKIWTDCIICVKFPDCDETAMMREF
jgi:amino-acid N-acetyltransferase